MIRLDLPATATVNLGIYDVAGRLVRSLLAGETLSAGAHEQEWNGRDDAGRDQAAGLYLYRLRADEVELVRKMALVR